MAEVVAEAEVQWPLAVAEVVAEAEAVAVAEVVAEAEVQWPLAVAMIAVKFLHLRS